MLIAFIHGHMFNVHSWSKAAALLEDDGIALHLFSQQQSPDRAIAFMENLEADIVIGRLFHDLPMHDELLKYAQKSKHRLGIGQEMPPDFSTYTSEQISEFSRYLSSISIDNYVNGIRYLAACSGLDIKFEEPSDVLTNGIYHPDVTGLFSCIWDYLEWYKCKNSVTRPDPVIGITCHYNQIAEDNHRDADMIIRTLESNNMIPLCVCSDSGRDSSLPLPDRYPWLSFLKESTNIVPSGLSAIINLMSGRLLAKPEDTFVFEDLNVPVFQAIRLFHQHPDEWAGDNSDLVSGSSAMIYGLAQPEMSGVIEPTMVAGTVMETDPGSGVSSRRYLPVKERIEHLCRRVKGWHRLRTLPNNKKQVTIILHNNPCKAVEATLGVAAGLDTFESLSRLINSMRYAGYDVGEAPQSGKAILDMFMDRKAVSEFRWTTVDEIVEKGGDIYRMNGEEYSEFFDSIPQKAQNRVLQDWGEFPGEGMVFNKKGEPELLVTGLCFGNLKIMLQPKRGCYGSKCNGEVCRILHDPELSPPHHWFASYCYIRKTSDAVIHFGTHGAMEFLPGKRAALSDACFPEITLGDLPNIYLYIMDVSGDGMVAKRRGRAVLIDHLTPVYRPAVMDDKLVELERLVKEYHSALDNNEKSRMNIIQQKMLELMKSKNLVDQEYDGTDFYEEVGMLSRRIARIRRALAPSGMHTLGTFPDSEGIATMIATMLIKQADGLPSLDEIAALANFENNDSFDTARDIIRGIIDTDYDPSVSELPAEFRDWCLATGNKIKMSDREIPQLLRALNGEYIEPGLSGSLVLGKTEALPTGRNFYSTDVRSLPTKSAYEAGCTLADNLLVKYIKEEDRFPESVGISLWSIDAFKSDGEVFCQILHLMGMRPKWNSSGQTTGVEAIPLSELYLSVGEKSFSPRPRIDVVIQTSGILRDMVPHFADFLDEAAVMASTLEESHELNFIRKHTDERFAEIKAELGNTLSIKQMSRMASFRVFSSLPGTYGIGVGLALDASAWEDEKDLAETYINWGGYAYGSDRSGDFERISGQAAHDLYARNLKCIDVTYMRQYSPEYDLVDVGGYAGYLGGMSVAIKAVGGKSVKQYWADNNAENDLSVRNLKEELETSVISRLINKNWIEDMKEHGYKGASGVSGRVNNLFKWSATTQKVDKWVFDEIVETYISNLENLEWLRAENPYALEELTRRLIEAESRGLWEADQDMMLQVRDAALMIEGDMEEMIGEVTQEFQGSKVDVMTAKDVDKWQPKWNLKSELQL